MREPFFLSMTTSIRNPGIENRESLNLDSTVRQAEARDVVMILGYTSWSGAARRGWIHAEDRLTLFLMRSPKVGRLLVCNPYRSVVAKAARRLAGQPDESFPATAGRTLFEPLRVRRHDPVGTRAIARSVGRYEARVRRAAERAGLERPAIVTTHPLVAGHGDFGWAGPVTYYANDDLTACPPWRRWWPAFDDAFDRARERGRHGVGLTPRALESIRPGGRGEVIPCGLEPSEWLFPARAPEWFRALPGPRFVYVGSLDARVATRQVLDVAVTNPGASVVLVGPMLDRNHYAGLAVAPNVYIHPPVSRAELAGLVREADVGLIPHVRSEQTEAMSPLKLYEYLAAGLPVAAVDLPGIASVCPERTALSRDGSDFALQAQEALALGRWEDRRRREFIRANSWERRCDQLLEVAFCG